MAQKHVGIDISKDTFNAAFQTSKGCWSDAEFENKPSGRRKLLEWAGAEGVFTMEATGYYHMETALFLHGKKRLVHVANPMLVKRFSQMLFQRGKTDKADARMIAEFALCNEDRLRDWKPAEGRLGEARSLLTAIKQVSKQITQSTNCLGALKLTKAGKIAALAMAVLLRSQRRALHALESSLQTIVKEEFKDMYNAIMTIPGIGPKTTVALIVCTNGFKEFKNQKQVTAYVGLSPRVFESGSSVRGKGHICKLGNPYLRKLLYMCAVSSLMHNPVCKTFSDSLDDKGKAKKVAIVAVANKLLRIAFSVAKSKTTWNPELAMAH
jgi:transposase